MTDNEIIKALEICNSLHLRCGNGCPYYEVPYKDGKRCSEMMIDDTLGLINRQKAEIERLQIRNKTLTEITKNYDWKFKKAKTESIKEFAERLKEELRLNTENNGGFVPSMIDNLVKEMTE